MSSPDDKTFPVAAKPRGSRFRRTVSVNDFTLPKPYEKKPFVEDEPQLSKTRMALIGAAGLAAAGIVVAIAMVAKENLDTKPVLVIAAPLDMPQLIDEPAPPVKKPRSALASAKRPSSDRPAMAALGAKDYPQVRNATRPALLAVSARTVRALRPAAPKPEPVAHDPDVDLITAILLLSPPARADLANAANAAVAVCTPESHQDSGCPLAPHGNEP